MNIQWQFIDCNSQPIVSQKVLFTPVKSPEITASYLTTADSYQFTTSVSGVLSASVVANVYKVEIAKPAPQTTFYLKATETGSYIYSGSLHTGSVQNVFFDLFNLVRDPTSVKKLTVTPAWNYAFEWSGSKIVTLAASSSVPDITGSCTYATLVPGVYQCDALGKVVTTFFISVPTWESTSSAWSPSWNAKDLLIVRPSKGIPVRLNNADNSYVLTVSSSDARYAPKFSGTTGSHALYAEGADFALLAGSAIYVQTASFATSSLTASNVVFNGNRAITRDDPDFQGINVGGTDVVTFLNNFFFPFVPATISINSGTTYYQTGSSNSISLTGTTTVNDETSFGTSSIWRSGVEWLTDLGTGSYSETDTGVAVNRTYQAKLTTGTSGVVSSGTKTITFLYPFLYGTSSIAGLTGTSLYNALLKDITPKANKTYNFTGSAQYIYVGYPSSYGALTEILDPNLFNMISSFQYSSSVSVTSTGLTYNWTHDYSVYRLELLADPDGNYQFKY